MPQLNNLNVEALLRCDMYALIIAREIREGNRATHCRQKPPRMDRRWTESALYTNE